MKKPTDSLKPISQLGVEALIEEASLSPKPGLVDAFDTGSHRDMDIHLLITSANALHQGFYDYLCCGYQHQGDLDLLFQQIRSIGIRTEATMFEATNRINTHKGANFSFGLVLGALGFYFARRQKTFAPLTQGEITEIFEIIKGMTKDLVKKDFQDIHKKAQLSYGERLYLHYGFGGIRQEAEEGYPIITQLALPKLIHLYQRGISKERAYTEVLFSIMAVAEDSNIIHRGGFDSLAYVKAVALDFLQGGGVLQPEYQRKIEALNEDFKKRNLSPGGSADLLALTIFLGKLMGVYHSPIVG